MSEAHPNSPFPEHALLDVTGYPTTWDDYRKFNEKFRRCPKGYAHPEIIEAINKKRQLYKVDWEYRAGKPLRTYEIVHSIERDILEGGDGLSTAKIFHLSKRIVAAIAAAVAAGELVPWHTSDDNIGPRDYYDEDEPEDE